jgi:hypothetical protein
MKTNYNAEYIKGLVGGYWDEHRPWGYDREGFITYVDQTMHLIGRESDLECMKYICRKFSRDLTDFFYLIMNNDKYIDQLDEYSESPVEELREFATTLMCNIVIAGSTDDFSSIEKYMPKF